jgi:hypothetical protein
MESAFESLIPIIGIIFVFGIPGIIIFWYIHAKHRERMRLIEKGLTPEEIKQYFSGLYKGEKKPYSALKWGMLLAFLGLGFFLSEVLIETTDVSDSVTPAFLLFFAGLAFLIYYFIVSKKRNGIASNGK